MQSKDIIELQNAIRATHECDSRWEGSVKVEEMFEGKTAWSGIVEIFSLVGHPKAKFAYAWTYRDGKSEQNNRGPKNPARRFALQCR